MALLHVVSSSPQTVEQADDAIRRFRRMTVQAEQTLLLFCDLPDADAARLPEDDALIRRLQSGVMSIRQQLAQSPLLLVRRRAWDDVARAFLGRGQKADVRQVIAQLLLGGKTPVHFEAANFSPGSLQGKYDAVLFTSLSLACTPDTPQQMLARLQRTPQGCVCADVLSHRGDPPTLLERLTARGFSFRPLAALQNARQRHRGAFSPLDKPPAIFTSEALRKAFIGGKSSIPCSFAEDCSFVSLDIPTLNSAMHAAHSRYLCRPCEAFCPVVQILLLIATAISGNASLAYIALLAPEAFSLIHPMQWPGLLVRTAFLPAHAVASLDALLALAFARSRRFRLMLPSFLKGVCACIVFGAVTLVLAARSVYALMPLLPLSLLWLATPLVREALHRPSHERIPLSQKEKEALRSEAQALYPPPEPSSACSRMLCACAACMLGLLEPDEAARKAEACLPDAKPKSGFDQACVLAAAQYLRERMGDCDAALRPLPAQLETLVLSTGIPTEGSTLAAMIRIARNHVSTSTALTLLQGLPSGDDADALFLPQRFGSPSPEDGDALPLTHPHTDLRRKARRESPDIKRSDVRFLALSSTLLDHPFALLLMRSPVIAPYAPLLAFLQS